MSSDGNFQLNKLYANKLIWLFSTFSQQFNGFVKLINNLPFLFFVNFVVTLWKELRKESTGEPA